MKLGVLFSSVILFFLFISSQSLNSIGDEQTPSFHKDTQKSSVDSLYTLSNNHMSFEFFPTNPAAAVRYDNDSDGDPTNDPILGWLIYKAQYIDWQMPFNESVSISPEATGNNSISFEIILADGLSSIDATWTLFPNVSYLFGNFTINRRSDELVWVDIVLLRFNSTDSNAVPNLVVIDEGTKRQNESLETDFSVTRGPTFGSFNWLALHSPLTGMTSGIFNTIQSECVGLSYSFKNAHIISQYIRDISISILTAIPNYKEGKYIPGPTEFKTEVCYYLDFENSFEGIESEFQTFRYTPAKDSSSSAWQFIIVILTLTFFLRIKKKLKHKTFEKR